jgi:RNA-directed DNA polymerase
MKESHVKGLANHDGPESCTGARKGAGEALTGERAGRVLSREINLDRDAELVRRWGRPQPTRRNGKAWRYPARSETPGMHGSNLRENREILRPPKRIRLGRIVKSKDVRR